MASEPRQSRYGPSCPKFDMDTITRRGLDSTSESKPSPSRSITPGRKFSTTTSAVAASLRAISAPAPVFRSSVTLRLLVLRCRKRPLRSRVRLVVGKRPKPPRRVARPGALDLQHVRAVVGHQLGAVGAGDVVGEVEDSHVRESFQAETASGGRATLRAPSEGGAANRVYFRRRALSNGAWDESTKRVMTAWGNHEGLPLHACGTKAPENCLIPFLLFHLLRFS